VLLQFCESLVDGSFQRLHVPVEVVVQCRSLEVAPEPFDQVQFGAIPGQPYNKDVVRVILKQLPDRLRAVIRGVVEHQDQSSLGIGFHQLEKEFGELLRVLLGMNHVVRLPATVVQRTIDAHTLVASCRRDHRPDTAKRPDLRQGRVEMNLTLIEVEQVEGCLRMCRPLFTNSKNAFFSSYSCESRKCDIPCLGRR
jgi:hypothetical protein